MSASVIAARIRGPPFFGIVFGLREAGDVVASLSKRVQPSGGVVEFARPVSQAATTG
jgi:hypothetical protein